MEQGIYVRVCLIVIQDEKILLVPHFDTDRGPIQYNLPGGGVEFGETLEDAVLREFQEETGYEASCIGFFDLYEHRKSDWHSITIAFWGAISGGAPRAEQTHWGERAPQWFSADELLDVAYHPIPLIDRAMGIGDD